MTAPAIIAATVGPGLLCFFLLLRTAPEEIPLDAVLLVAGLASLVWPLALLYLLAIRPPAEERHAARRVRLAELHAAEARALTERERHLGIGSRSLEIDS